MKLRSREREASTQPREREQGVAPSKASRYGNAYMQEQLSASGVPSGAVAHTGGRASIPSGDSGPPPRVEDGSAEQEQVIKEAVREGRRMAIVGLGVLRSAPSSERERALADAHFHTTDPALLAKASALLGQTLTGMNGTIPIEVESTSSDEKVAGYVRKYVRQWTDIHLTPRFFQLGPAQQGATVLHESTHKYAGTEDHAYLGTAEYSTLTPEEALENADSYASFCQLHLGDRLAEREQQHAAEAREAAVTHAEEVWTSWEAGKLDFGESTFTTSTGIVIPAGLVKGIILERFSVRYPKRRADIVAHLEAQKGYIAVTCQDGYLASSRLVHGIADEEGL